MEGRRDLADGEYVRCGVGDRHRIQGDATRAGLKAALDSKDFNLDTASGPLSFLPSGDRPMVDRLVKVEAGTRSGAGYDFIPFTPFE